MINNAETLLFKLFKFYDVYSNNELSQKIDVSAGTISKWKQRNSINAIKKKCRELGIYDEIFKDIQNVAQEGQRRKDLEDYESYLESKVKEYSPDYLEYARQNFLSKPEIPFDDIDFATSIIFKEVYKEAVDNNDLKRFRIYLLNYSDDSSK